MGRIRSNDTDQYYYSLMRDYNIQVTDEIRNHLSALPNDIQKENYTRKLILDYLGD